MRCAAKLTVDRNLFLARRLLSLFIVSARLLVAENKYSYARLCTEGRRVIVGKRTWPYRVLYNGITYYTSRISGVETCCVGQINVAAS